MVLYLIGIVNKRNLLGNLYSHRTDYARQRRKTYRRRKEQDKRVGRLSCWRSEYLSIMWFSKLEHRRSFSSACHTWTRPQLNVGRYWIPSSYDRVDAMRIHTIPKCGHDWDRAARAASRHYSIASRDRIEINAPCLTVRSCLLRRLSPRKLLLGPQSSMLMRSAK